jgi:formylglycine-generating enzyme required for sulfatase activity
MARYPVTVAQFRAYHEASGEQRGKLYVLGTPDNHPVASIDWYQALAFCQWLTRRWREQELLPKGWGVGLPSEPEWEKAARGGLQIPGQPLVGCFDPLQREIALVKNSLPARRYPWGNEPDSNCANYRDTEIGNTSSVGCFPAGASPYGCEEMSGNVWEWTRSLWGDYPYPEEGPKRLTREDLAAESERVLRGGSFFNDPRRVRCAYRFHLVPGRRNLDFGFRVVVSPFFSGR